MEALFSISAKGVALKAVAELADDELPNLRFQFSQFQTWVEAEGEIVWKSDSEKIGGVRFVGLPLEVRQDVEDTTKSKRELEQQGFFIYSHRMESASLERCF